MLLVHNLTIKHLNTFYYVYSRYVFEMASQQVKMFNEKRIYDLTKYKNKGLTGLTNLGNTCFMNSCLQCLSHTYELRELFSQSQFKKRFLDDMKPCTLLKEWVDLNDLMWSENCIISCDRWLECVHKRAHEEEKLIFTGYQQNDCSEFLMFVLDNFHENIKRGVKMTIKGTPETENDKLTIRCFERMKEMYEKEYSEFIGIFYGIQITHIYGENNVVHSQNPEPFFIMNLSIPQEKKEFTLEDSLMLFQEGEKLCGENAWYNERTKTKEDVIIKTTFWTLPNILIVCLKRFNKFRKIQTPMIISNSTSPLEGDFSIKINMSCFLESENESVIYEVYGMCIHSGSLMGGHYYSVIKTANGTWYVFNDQEVSEIKNPKTEIPSLYSKSYCLFMKKI